MFISKGGYAGQCPGVSATAAYGKRTEIYRQLVSSISYKLISNSGQGRSPAHSEEAAHQLQYGREIVLTEHGMVSATGSRTWFKEPPEAEQAERQGTTL